MGFAERLAKSVVTDTLEHSETQTMPVELVASMSGASRLGSDLFRAADADAAAFRRALLLLTKYVIDTLRIGRGMAQRLANMAIQETLHWQCRRCNGAGQVVVGDLKVICPICSGTTVHRWTDKERARVFGVAAEKWQVWEREYSIILCHAQSVYLSTPMQAKQKLGA